MNNIDSFIQNHKKISIAIVILVIVLFITIPIILFLAQKDNKQETTEKYNGEVTYYQDNISGKEMGDINQEPENSANGFVVIGLDILIDMGYTTQQYDIVYNKILNYFNEKYPDIYQVSYLKNSFKYDPEDSHIASFTIIAPTTNESFIVNLDNTAKKLFTIQVSIDKA